MDSYKGALRTEADGYFYPARIILFALLLTVLLIAGCKEERVDLIVDNYINFLEITPEQEPDIRKILTEAKTVIANYYVSYDSAETAKNRYKLSKKEVVDLKISMMNNLYPVYNKLRQSLTRPQRSIFARSELNYLYSETRSDILKDYRADNEIPYQRHVFPVSRNYSDNNLNDNPFEPWTIYFGQSMFPSLFGSTRESISKNARRNFPIGIQATLINNYKPGDSDEETAADEEPDKYTEIRLMLFSRLHESFSDIERWVVFIECSDGTQIEPVKIVKQDRDWFSENRLLFSNELPPFLMNYSIDREEKPSRAGDNQRAEPEFDRRSRFGMTLHRNYYQVYFPKSVNNKPLLSPSRDFIKLVFLEEVGSKETAHGVWFFNWRGITVP